MQVSKDAAVAILKELGYKDAGKMKAKRLRSVFNKEVVKGDLDGTELKSCEDEDLKDIFDNIMYLDEDEVVTIYSVNPEPINSPDDGVEEYDDAVPDSTEEDKDNVSQDGDLSDAIPDEEEAESEEFKVGDWVQVSNPQYPGVWVGQLKEIQNEDYGLVVAVTDEREWEEAFEFMTITKVPKGAKTPKVKRLNREEMVVKTIKDELGGPIKMADVAKIADENFVAQGGGCKTHIKRVVQVVSDVVAILEAFGVVKAKGDELLPVKEE